MIILWFLLGFGIIGCVFSSEGDYSPIYYNCFRNCRNINCSDKNIQNFYGNQTFWLALTLWTCPEECKYNCMWRTVESLQSQFQPIPQFHGKWPFKRMLGIQEPASVIFSILNGISFMHLLNTVRQRTRGLSGMRPLWFVYSLMGLHTWFWSTVFHARDTDFTERMDYFCAYSSILTGLYVCTMSIFYLWLIVFCLRLIRPNGNLMSSLVVAIPFLCFFLKHISFLIDHMDYGYNMKVNVITGALSSLLWLLIFCKEWLNGKGRHFWPCILVVLWANLALTLELADFPPLFWIFDAHCLWHLATVPLAYILSIFVRKDCEYLYSLPKTSKYV